MIAEDAADTFDSRCDCGANRWSHFDQSRVNQRVTYWKDWLKMEVAKIRTFDEMTSENARAIMGPYGEDTTDIHAFLPALRDTG